ncbi:MAG: hypothetical protein ABSH16_01060 [Sedimentisphaerales bacterium]
MIIKQESQKDVLKYLENELLKITPSVKIAEYVNNIDDVYEKRAILKECRWDYESFDYLLSIFTDTVTNRQRFRKKADCFNIIRLAVKRNFNGCQFPENILDKLFYLFKEFILMVPPVNSDIVNCLSVALKDQVLKDNNVIWLVQNAAKDETILNRLLRYPTRNKIIEEWAIQSVDSSVIEGRESELYGILIKDKIPNILKEKDRKHLAWGVYYSKVANDIKEKLLLELAGEKNYRSICEISYRLNLPNVPRRMVEQIINNKSSRTYCQPLVSREISRHTRQRPARAGGTDTQE